MIKNKTIKGFSLIPGCSTLPCQRLFDTLQTPCILCVVFW